MERGRSFIEIDLADTLQQTKNENVIIEQTPKYVCYYSIFLLQCLIQI